MKAEFIKKTAATVMLFLAINLVLAASQNQVSSEHLISLTQQGLPQESILGVDADGVPRVCGTGLETAATLVLAGNNTTLNLLPAGMRSWECIPNVIRDDGVESFRVEVDVNGPVSRIIFDVNTNYFISLSGSNTVPLRDDGLNGDRIAGDYVFISEPIRHRLLSSPPIYRDADTNAIPGAYMVGAGVISIVETNNLTSKFLVAPYVGVLESDIPAVQVTLLASNIQASTHFLNLITTNREAQRGLRYSASMAETSKRIFSVLPDAFDFLSYLTTDHIEYLPATTSANYTSGRHNRLRISFTGTGSVLYDIGNAFGSTNRLKGMNIFDTLQRGISDSHNAFHEYMHLWSSHTSTTLGLTSDGSHYLQNCSADSVVGGYHATFLTNGSTIRIRRDCIGFTQASPIDKYMMGLISTSAVPTLYIITNYPGFNCENLEFFANAKQVTISDIVAVHGVRTPGPESAQRHFSIGFVAGSHQRLLNATEMTFYDYMAEYFTRPWPDEWPAPNFWDGYVPISRFVGEGVTWSSKGLGLIRPTITNVQWQANGFQVDGSGYSGRNYRLLATTNLTSWTQVTNRIADTNGNFTLLDNSQPRPARRWYKVVTP